MLWMNFEPLKHVALWFGAILVSVKIQVDGLFKIRYG